MSVEPGRELLHFRIVNKIGEGGMGVVWKAVDSSLGREVAIKLLPVAFVADAERLGRFEREARLLASLNHPNIASIYGLHTEPSDGLRFLSMEWIAGEDLEQRLARGPLPPDEAIGVALQIAIALEAAHENGIVHRDLKPANIRFAAAPGTSQSGSLHGGTVKVLDFGLAKALDADRPTQSASQSPTLTDMSTQAGMILGTAGYMAPEQARGHAADRRADIWAFGVVLYEMLTGMRPFSGSTVSDTLADILRAEPDLDALPDETPRQLRRLIARCLAKDPAQRLQAIGDARLELQDAREVPEHPVSPGAAGSTGRRRFGGAIVGTLAVVALVATIAAVAGWLRTTAPPRRPTHLSIALPPDEELSSAPSISRDGRQIAYASQRGVEPSRLYVRSLDSYEPRPVSGTDDAREPFFSPDGRAVGFFADGSLKAVELSGGSPRVLSPAPAPFGASWGDDDHIVFTQTINAGLMRIPAGGGPVENLTRPDLGAQGYAHVWPQVLPGSEQVMFTVWGGETDTGGVAIFDRRTGSWSTILPGLGAGTFVDTGYVLTPWDHEVDSDFAAVRASPISDVRTRAGAPVATVLERVFAVPWREESWLSVASNGTLAYVPGTVADRELVWVDQQGTMQPASGFRAVHDNIALSPDGRRAAVKNGADIWVYDLEDGTRIRLTTEGHNGGPLWDREGKRVFFSSNRSGDWDLYVRSADGTGETEHLWEREYSQWTNSIAPDGTLLLEEPNPETGQDLWIRDPDGTTRPLFVIPGNQEAGAFSPDGRWLAYTSNESGRNEIYLVPYPGPGPRVPVSRDGGMRARWSPDGNTLYYFQGNTVMGATVDRRKEVKVTDRRPLFTGNFFTRYSWTWDVAPDGRFLMIHRKPGSVPNRIHVVLDWTAELDRLASRD